MPSRYELSDAIVDSIEAEICYTGNRAYYERPFPSFENKLAGDVIYMPPPERFADINEFHFTRFHEIWHWLEARIGWTGSENDGEIIANMFANYFCQMLGIPTEIDLAEAVGQISPDKRLNAPIVVMEAAAWVMRKYQTPQLSV